MNPKIDETGEALDTFLSVGNIIERAIQEYVEHKHFIVAFDMDDTVWVNNGCCCDQVVELLRVCSAIPSMRLVVFTARSPENYNETINQLNKLGIRYDAINENIDRSSNKNNKIFFNIFLDDRAGLPSAYEALVGVVNWYFYQGGMKLIEQDGR